MLIERNIKLCGRYITLLEHIIIVEIKLTSSRTLTYYGLFLKRNSCDKRGLLCNDSFLTACMQTFRVCIYIYIYICISGVANPQLFKRFFVALVSFPDY